MSSDDESNSRDTSRSWNRPASSAPRIGRIGAWGGSSSSGGGSSGGSRIRGLADLGGGGAPSGFSGDHGRPHPQRDDEDDEDDEDENDPGREGETWFAGGERSGVSIQNPDAPGAAPGGNLVRDILRKAAEGSREAPPPAASSSSAFTGGGHTLGSDEVESSFIPDPNANDPDRLPPAVRVITMWQDGFSVEDGELLRYDTPENRNLLALINNGQAPPSILNVELGQPVELRIMKRLNENYVAPKRSTSAFGGTGNRLGAPVPSTSSSPANIPGSFPADSSDVGSRNTGFEVDRTLPTTRIQLRLADGTSLVCEMNHHHTVQDIRNIINAARLENSARPYTISTTFPNRTLEDNTKTIKEADLLNSVIVQRWA